MVLFIQRIVEILQQFFLLLRKFFRYFYIHSYILVTTGIPPQQFHTLTTQTEFCSALCTFRNGILYISINGRHSDFCTQNCLCIGNRNVTINIAALPFKQRMRHHFYCYINITSRTTVQASIALAANTDGFAIIDACRNIQFQIRSRTNPSAAFTLAARVGNDFTPSAATATYTGARNDTKWCSLVGLDTASAITFRTNLLFCVAVCTCSVTLWTSIHMCKADGFLYALTSLHKADPNIAVNIAAPSWCVCICCGTSSTAAAKAAESTENALENIAHVAKAAEITCSAASSGKVRVYTSMPKLVIPCPFVCI